MGTLGSRLRASRERKDLTQLRVAKILGITNVQLSRYESDINKPDPDLLVKMADLYEVSTDFLLGRADGQRDLNPLVRRVLENQPGNELPLSDEEIERLTKLLEDPDMHIAFRKGVLGKQANPRRLLKTLELLAMDDEDGNEN